jgi:hypothetical protein
MDESKSTKKGDTLGVSSSRNIGRIMDAQETLRTVKMLE